MNYAGFENVYQAFQSLQDRNLFNAKMWRSFHWGAPRGQTWFLVYLAGRGDRFPPTKQGADRVTPSGQSIYASRARGISSHSGPFDRRKSELTPSSCDTE